jgi:HpcH/HpaI aldolase/citrate lyase family
MVRPDRPLETFEPFDAFRVRRSCLAVPASSERFISKARGLPADEVFLDLEDAVAPAAKAQARANAVAAVTGDWGGRVLAVRVNDARPRGRTGTSSTSSPPRDGSTRSCCRR